MRSEVRFRGFRLTVLTLSLLSASLACAAQYPDQDTPGTPKTSANAPPPKLRIDINHASAGELAKIPGMTPSWAGRIVRFRPYRTKADLLEQGVVPSEIYDRIKDYVIAHQKAE